MKPDIQTALQKLFLLQHYAESFRKEIPPTRDELEKVGVLKKHLKTLESSKLCSTKLLIIKEGTGTSSCGRVSYSLTDLGREVCQQLGFRAPEIGNTESTEVTDENSVTQSL